MCNYKIWYILSMQYIHFKDRNSNLSKDLVTEKRGMFGKNVRYLFQGNKVEDCYSQRQVKG